MSICSLYISLSFIPLIKPHRCDGLKWPLTHHLLVKISIFFFFQSPMLFIVNNFLIFSEITFYYLNIGRTVVSESVWSFSPLRSSQDIFVIFFLCCFSVMVLEFSWRLYFSYQSDDVWHCAKCYSCRNNFWCRMDHIFLQQSFFCASESACRYKRSGSLNQFKASGVLEHLENRFVSGLSLLLEFGNDIFGMFWSLPLPPWSVSQLPESWVRICKCPLGQMDCCAHFPGLLPSPTFQPSYSLFFFLGL